MRKIFFLLLIVAFILGTLIIFRNAIARFTLNQLLTQTIGAETAIDKVNIGIFDSVVEINGLKIYNPRGFINETFLEMPQVSIGYDRQELFNLRLHITTLTIALRELAVAINEKGAINIDQLKVLHPQEKKQGPVELPKFTIDKFVLKIGRVETKNYANKENTALASVDFRMKERVYKNITSFQGLAGSILIDTMKMAGIKGAQVYGEHLLGNLGKSLVKQLGDKKR